MSMIQVVALKKRQKELQLQQQQDSNPSSPSTESPTKPAAPLPSIPSIGSLGKQQSLLMQPKRRTTPPADNQLPNPPTKIEEVPFRRQDRRTLNLRNKRVMDRKLIACLISCGVFIFLAGTVLFVLYWLYESEKPSVLPFIVIGPVLCVFGIMMLLFSVEICIRLKKNVKKVMDPEIDNVDNLHNVKHWIHPELVAYGWGHSEDEYEMSADRGRNTNVPLSDKPGFKLGGRDDPHGDQKVEPNEVDDDNPHRIMAQQMLETKEDEIRRKLSISSDIFDESLRYSKVDRPRLAIERSSPVSRAQIRGDFVDEEERIANLFTPKKKKK